MFPSAWSAGETNERFDISIVIGCDSGKRYRIRYGSATNVQEIDEDGRSTVGWCFVPKGYLVAGDVMLAQKIALETKELGALAVANRFRTSPKLGELALSPCALLRQPT